MFYRNTIKGLEEKIDKLTSHVKDLEIYKADKHAILHIWETQDEWLEALNKIREIHEDAELYLDYSDLQLFIIPTPGLDLRSIHSAREYYLKNKYRDCRERAAKEWDER